MEAAAEATLRAISSHFGGELAGRKALILCGPGNNGGDGAALALRLGRLGVQTELILFGAIAETKGDARTNFEMVRKLASVDGGSDGGSEADSVSLTFLECSTVSQWETIAQASKSYDIIVDALFGTGLKRPLEGIFSEVIRYLASVRESRSGSPNTRTLIVAVDLPSGLNADSAQLIGETVQADLTVTFTAPKLANVLPPASHLCGKLIVANIGSPSSLLEDAQSKLFLTEEEDARRWLISTRYTKESYKNTHGHVLVIAGSRGYTGAAVLCGNAAIRSGAGLVTIATPASAQPLVASSVMPEVMTVALAETDRGAVSEKAVDHVMKLASKASIVALGPGLSAEDERTRGFVRSVVERRTTPIVIDADGLNCLAPWPGNLQGSKELPLILTPHLGEMMRLMGTTKKLDSIDRVSAARQFAVAHKVILVLKGSRSLIASDKDFVVVNPTGNAGLGTAGAGDTLTGIIAGFGAQARGSLGDSANLFSSTIAALYVGGVAGDIAARERGMRTMVASDIREHLGSAVRHLDREGEMP